MKDDTKSNDDKKSKVDKKLKVWMFFKLVPMQRLEKDVNTFVKEFIKKTKALYKSAKSDNNKRLAADMRKKFPFVDSKSGFPSVDEIMLWESFRERFSKEDIGEILAHYVKKITGLYKHGQTEKTGLCNMRILSNVKRGSLTIAISKNTLDAKQQWEERLIKALKEQLPGESLKDCILVISSKKNDLNGNATHCKTVNDAFAHYARGNFKIIFVCSNSTRINDILTFLDLYESLAVEKRMLIDVQQDEAHNKEEGVPSKREMVENIIISPYVESYVPVTASYEPLIVETSHLWKRTNLDSFAIDYTKNSDTISTSKDYSSISDANQITFESMRAHPSYIDHKIEEFDEETFAEADSKDYTGWDEAVAKADKDRRRQLEFCCYMKYEGDACNLGMNFLDNYLRPSHREGDTITETPLILTGIRNIHIITTPHRVALTIHLMKHAIQQPYNPLCIGLYNSGIHILFNNRMGQTIRKKYSDLVKECSSEEMNNKIFDILQHVKSMGETTDRPIIIMGNYKPTGESITFVNYKYGTIRSDILLPIAGLTKEKSYQGFLRSCYKDTKFVEHDPDFVHPPKWIIGSQSSINDAMFYEKQNDQRIFTLKNTDTGVPLTPVVNRDSVEGSTCAVPMRLTVLEMGDPYMIDLLSILKKKKRNDEDKRRVLERFLQLINNGAMDYVDPTGKFDFRTYTLKDIRTWKQHTPEEIEERKKEKEEPFEADYRFSEYDSKHRNKMPYINNKGKIGPNECELLVAYDKYEYKGFVNHRSRMWLSYRIE